MRTYKDSVHYSSAVHNTTYTFIFILFCITLNTTCHTLEQMKATLHVDIQQHTDEDD